MRRDKQAPEIIGRLRVDADERLDEPLAPRHAALAGWVIVVALVGTIIYVAIRMNPL